MGGRKWPLVLDPALLAVLSLAAAALALLPSQLGSI
jgi:hypothetical protein